MVKFNKLSLDVNVDNINKDHDQIFVKALNQDVDYKNKIRGSARSLNNSNDLTVNGLKFHSLDSLVQKKMDSQNKVITKEINPKFSLKEECYFDGFSFFSQSKGYTLDDIDNSKKWCVNVPYGIYKGNSYHKSLGHALKYVYASKNGNCKITNTITNEIIGFGQYKPMTTIKYLDNKVNRTYEQNQELRRIDNLVLSKEEIKKRNLEKMLKKD